MRLATPLVIVALLVVLSGCGDSSSEETTTAPPVERGEVAEEKVRATWQRNPACERPQGASRWGCSVGAYRCQAVVVDRGWSVSCAKPGESIAFRVRPG
jgi:hypothetical protein